MKKIIIFGASGYTGVELLRILDGHPESQVVGVTSRQYEGELVEDVFPALAGSMSSIGALTFKAPDADKLVDEADFFFTAVPHKTAMEVVPTLLSKGGKVVDLSADFRFNDQQLYEKHYQPHTAPELLAETVYGLPELHRERIKSARLVGAPGCYPTSIILAAAPLVKNKLVETRAIIADSKTGISGGGRGAKLGFQFSEINDGAKAYGVISHRHTPEVEKELELLAGGPVTLSFTPHLVPLTRGILSTVYGRMISPMSQQEVHDLFAEFYKDEKFVRLKKPGSEPNTLDVRGTNFCDLSVFVDERAGLIKVISIIDNLTRGSSGQAVWAMNLMEGFAEETALTGLGLRP